MADLDLELKAPCLDKRLAFAGEGSGPGLMEPGLGLPGIPSMGQGIVLEYVFS